ncbi:MAG: helix-turn-helix domain-containing protein [Bacteroidales bacterium]|nr:helix-turn-helix domain-containing protein [Bacteroidales bacterium]
MQRLYNVLRFMDSIGKAIEKRRKELGVTQEQLSELCDVSINTLISVERSQGNPTLRVVNEILSVLGMHLEVKINDNEEAESIQQ